MIPPQRAAEGVEVLAGVPQGGSWRRSTATTARRARKILGPLLPCEDDPAPRVATFRAGC